MHLWWIAPVLLLTIPISATLFNGEKVLQQPALGRVAIIFNIKTISVTLVAFSLIGGIQGAKFVAKDWSEYSLPVLRGTYAESTKVDSQRIFDVIPQYAIPGSSSFDCLEGIYSVATGSYLASDQWFVNWGNNIREHQDFGEVRFICNKPRKYAEAFAKDHSFSLVLFRENSNQNSIAVLKNNGR
jgi:hypothetical protein